MVAYGARIGLLAGVWAAVALGGGGLWGAVSSAEDLTGCKLPNGRVVLPAMGSSQAQNGPLYKFSKGEFGAIPTAEGGKMLTADEAQARVKEARSADLQYMPEKGGSLWAFSEVIGELPGVMYLSDVSGKKLEAPFAIPKTSLNYAGQCLNVREGGVYLVKTTEGQFVLLRVLEKGPTAAVIQYVYQGNGTLTFEIPPNATVAYQRPVEAEPAATRPTATAAGVVNGGGIPTTQPAENPTVGPRLPTAAPPVAAHPALGPGDVVEPGVIRLISGSTGGTGAGVEPSVDTFAHQRTQMLQRRLDIIVQPARAAAEIERKAKAIAELAYLHPSEPEVADVLVTEITFLNTQSSNVGVTPDALLPCYAALKHMGKPATLAAIRGIKKLNLESPAKGIDSPMNKAELLMNVVRAVEGKEAGEFLIKMEATRETDPKARAALEYALTTKG